MVVDDYGHHPTEIAAVHCRGARRHRPPRRRRVPAAPLHADQPADARVRRRARRRRRGRADRHLRRRRGADSGRDHRGARRRRPRRRAVSGARRQGARGAARGGGGPVAERRSRDHARRRLDRHGRGPDPRGDSRARRGQRGTGDEGQGAGREELPPRAGQARQAEGRARLDLVARASRAVVCAASRGLRRLPRRSISSPARRRCRCGGSPCTATCGCRPARCRRWSTACAARTSSRPDLAAYRRRLLESPWVADVALRRVLPSTVEVFVSERRPIGLCRLGSQLYLVDRAGHGDRRVRPAVRRVRPADHRRPGARAAGGRAGDRRRARGARGARHRRARGRKRPRAAPLADRRRATRTTPSCCSTTTPRSLHLGEERFLERLQSYVELAPALRERVPEIDYVDLRFDERVYVRPVNTAR